MAVMASGRREAQCGSDAASPGTSSSNRNWVLPMRPQSRTAAHGKITLLHHPEPAGFLIEPQTRAARRRLEVDWTEPSTVHRHTPAPDSPMVTRSRTCRGNNRATSSAGGSDCTVERDLDPAHLPRDPVVDGTSNGREYKARMP